MPNEQPTADTYLSLLYEILDQLRVLNDRVAQVESEVILIGGDTERLLELVEGGEPTDDD